MIAKGRARTLLYEDCATHRSLLQDDKPVAQATVDGEIVGLRIRMA